jgi:hypothetical protein
MADQERNHKPGGLRYVQGITTEERCKREKICSNLS